MRILIVEDESSVRALLDRILTGAGHRVQTASRPSEASAFVLYDAPLDPDLAILDLVLPERSGVKYAEDLRRMFPAIRLLFITGWYADYEAVEDQARKIGPVLYKPFRPQALLDAVKA